MNTPTHLGLILDGNRRWARANGLPTLEGHRQGYENLKTIAKGAFERGVQFVSAYIFSTENWQRTTEEVTYLMNLALKIASEDSKQLIKENIKIVVLGTDDRVSPKLIQAWHKAEELSKNNTGGTLAICFNYGGTTEITNAVREIVDSGVQSAKVTETLIAEHLYHPEVPAVDLMIRSSGENRISNFMLWRMAYAELYFLEKHWPDVTVEDLELALTDYAKRCRRYGGN